MTRPPTGTGRTGLTIATTVQEAVAALAAGAVVVAGGTDLVVGARQGKADLPPSLVAIDRIIELTEVRASDGGTTIGACVTHARLMTDPAIVNHYSALADGAALVGSPATRNVGTIGGNVMNGSPAMDGGAPLVVLGADVELRSSRGTRTLPIGQLWLGPGETAAADDELCTAVHLPPLGPRSGSAYVRLEYRRAMEIAVVGAAASVTLSEDHSTVEAISVALTAVGPTIVTVSGLDRLIGQPADGAMTQNIGALAQEQAMPISDLRAGEAYRRHTVGVMAERAFDAARARATGQVIAVPVNRALGIGATS